MPGKFWYGKMLAILRPKVGHFLAKIAILSVFGLTPKSCYESSYFWYGCCSYGFLLLFLILYFKFFSFKFFALFRGTNHTSSCFWYGSCSYRLLRENHTLYTRKILVWRNFGHFKAKILSFLVKIAIFECFCPITSKRRYESSFPPA